MCGEGGGGGGGSCFKIYTVKPYLIIGSFMFEYEYEIEYEYDF